jgi:hypothetical protein
MSVLLFNQKTVRRKRVLNYYDRGRDDDGKAISSIAGVIARKVHLIMRMYRDYNNQKGS